MQWLRDGWLRNLWAGRYSRAASDEQHLALDRPWHEEDGERGAGHALVSSDARTKPECGCASLESCAASLGQRRSKAQLAWKFLLVLLALWGTADLTRRTAWPLVVRTMHPIEDPSYWCRKACPQTAREAGPQGCVFDELENRFTKPECINEQITEEFRRSGPGTGGAWLYRTEIDGNMTTVDVSQVIELIEPGRVVWQTTRWHLLHCMFVWRKISLSRFDGTLLPMGREEEATHGEHCERLLATFLVGDQMDEYLAHTEY
ncbi:hypothetical protein MPH_09221 [Macrophomina phaseolina MS6]|uniref:Uncharacterized protein n=1 Tax=Macrophomina phaseolina (strain MS6) TaxID=1126212 RepID=K2RLD6_MACPH|nr:hypothetical protein MPH_09221 [Macrophomina phaseolina MS6]